MRCMTRLNICPYIYMAYSIITVVRGQKGMCPSESQGWTGAICHCFDSQCLRKVSKHTINVSRPRREYAYNKCIHNPYIGNISGNDCKRKTKDEMETNGRQTNENQNIAGSRRRKRGVPFTGVIKEGSSATR